MCSAYILRRNSPLSRWMATRVQRNVLAWFGFRVLIALLLERIRVSVRFRFFVGRNYCRIEFVVISWWWRANEESSAAVVHGSKNFSLQPLFNEQRTITVSHNYSLLLLITITRTHTRAHAHTSHELLTTKSRERLDILSLRCSPLLWKWPRAFESRRIRWWICNGLSFSKL